MLIEIHTKQPLKTSDGKTGLWREMDGQKLELTVGNTISMLLDEMILKPEDDPKTIYRLSVKFARNDKITLSDLERNFVERCIKEATTIRTNLRGQLLDIIDTAPKHTDQ